MFESMIPAETAVGNPPQLTSRQLGRILDRILNGGRPGTMECHQILRIEDPKLQEQVFETARKVRQCHFGHNVFLYGFLYFSTFCRNACRFCNYRSSNDQSPRHRKSPDEIIAAAKHFSSQVHLIDLTMGEDPAFFDASGDGFADLIDLVREVKLVSKLPIMVSPGVVPRHVLEKLAAAGADWFACYQETHNPSLFSRLRTGQHYDARWQSKSAAQRAGLLVEEGILCGVGESNEDVLTSLDAMWRLGADQVRVMQFVPQPGTPMADTPVHGHQRELQIVALLRLLFPDRLIPASLDVEGLSGLESRLMAGANVITSLVPPGAGFTGVSQCDLDIDTAKRAPAAIVPVLQRCNLKTATQQAYQQWVTHRRQQNLRRQSRCLS